MFYVFTGEIIRSSYFSVFVNFSFFLFSLTILIGFSINSLKSCVLNTSSLKKFT